MRGECGAADDAKAATGRFAVASVSLALSYLMIC